ncbi:non-histone protein [Coemansia sp. RSA 552]|nr:non-histone protein [Coemansia sp. RSA 552]
MSKGTKPKTAAAANSDGADEKHHKYRCRELRRQLEELEEYNDILAVKLQRSEKRLRRMKIERNILLERFEHTRQYAKHDDDDDGASSDSDAPLQNTFPRAGASDVDGSDVAQQGPPATGGAKRRRGAAGVGAGTHTSSGAGTPKHGSAAAGDNSATPTTATGRKPRAEKDPNAPKRPANAFVLYCQVERPNIKSVGTELSSSELTRAMGVKWRNLSKGEKQKYYDLYEREMTRYQRELNDYKGTSAAAASATAGAGSAPATTLAVPTTTGPSSTEPNSSPPAPPTATMDVDSGAAAPSEDTAEPPVTANGDSDSIGKATETPSEVVTPSTAAEREDGAGVNVADAARMHSPGVPPTATGPAEVTGQS